jgi:hypothetical protein
MQMQNEHGGEDQQPDTGSPWSASGSEHGSDAAAASSAGSGAAPGHGVWDGAGPGVPGTGGPDRANDTISFGPDSEAQPGPYGFGSPAGPAGPPPGSYGQGVPPGYGPPGGYGQPGS